MRQRLLFVIAIVLAVVAVIFLTSSKSKPAQQTLDRGVFSELKLVHAACPEGQHADAECLVLLKTTFARAKHLTKLYPTDGVLVTETVEEEAHEIAPNLYG